MDIHPSNDLHACKMKHEGDSESEIFQLVKYPFQYNLQARFIPYSRIDIMDIHPSNDLHTCKMNHEDDRESEIFLL